MGERPTTVEDYEPVARRLVAALDATELEILVGMVRGMSERDIAALLEIELERFGRYRTSLMNKLEARRASDAVRVGLHAGVDLPG